MTALQSAFRDVFVRHGRSGLWYINGTSGCIKEANAQLCVGGVLGDEAEGFAPSRSSLLLVALLKPVTHWRKLCFGVSLWITWPSDQMVLDRAEEVMSVCHRLRNSKLGFWGVQKG